MLVVPPVNRAPIVGEKDGWPARTQDAALAGGKGKSEDAAGRRLVAGDLCGVRGRGH
jgi:hypothetical protein